MATTDIASRIKSGNIDGHFKIDWKPYFLMEKGVDKGTFYVAKAITIGRDVWWGEPEANLCELVLGKDIIETPLEDLYLLVNKIPGENYEGQLQRIVRLLRHLAEISHHDYVSYLPYYFSESRTIFSKDGELLEVTPRLFRTKIL